MFWPAAAAYQLLAMIRLLDVTSAARGIFKTWCKILPGAVSLGVHFYLHFNLCCAFTGLC